MELKIGTVPHNIDSEKAVLGSVLVNPDSIIKIIDRLREDDFYAPKHKRIFKAMIDISDKGDPIDIITLSEQLRKNKSLESIGGGEYLTELFNFVPSAANIESYAIEVKKRSIRRTIISVGEEIVQIGYNETLDSAEEILNRADSKLYKVTAKEIDTKQYKKIGETLGSAYERLIKLNDTDELRGVHTGFASLDNILAGFQKSDLIILAARPSAGKTALALDIARKSAVKYNTKVGIFSIEMDSQELVDRMISAESSVDAWRLRTGKITNEEQGRIADVCEKLTKIPIFIDDRAGNNTLSIRTTARRMKKEHDIDLIIIDYLQLITPHSNSSDSIVQQVTEVSRALKQIARELQVPVIALSQLSRAVETRGGNARPKLSDLRDSGSIEQDADVVMFIHKEKKDDDTSDKVEILIEKHRNGPIGKVNLAFDKKKIRFLDIDKNIEG